MPESLRTFAVALFALTQLPAPALAMKWQDLPSSPNIEDRRGQKPMVSQSEEADPLQKFPELKARILVSRKNLLAAADLADKNDPVFSCEALKGHKDEISTLGRELKAGGDPEPFLQNPDTAALERIELEANSLNGSAPCRANLQPLLDLIAQQSDKFRKLSNDLSQRIASPTDASWKLLAKLKAESSGNSEQKAWYQFWKRESSCEKSTSSLMNTLSDLAESVRTIDNAIGATNGRLYDLKNQLTSQLNTCNAAKSGQAPGTEMPE